MTMNLKFVTLFPAALVLAGCAALAPQQPEKLVQERATEYWKARIAADFVKAYDLSTPSYRKLRTAAQFKQQFGAGANVKGAEVDKVVCEPEKCEVTIKVSVEPALAGLKIGALETYMTETWLLDEGQWWHYQTP